MACPRHAMLATLPHLTCRSPLASQKANPNLIAVPDWKRASARSSAGQAAAHAEQCRCRWACLPGRARQAGNHTAMNPPAPSHAEQYTACGSKSTRGPPHARTHGLDEVRLACMTAEEGLCAGGSKRRKPSRRLTWMPGCMPHMPAATRHDVSRSNWLLAASQTSSTRPILFRCRTQNEVELLGTAVIHLHQLHLKSPFTAHLLGGRGQVGLAGTTLQLKASSRRPSGQQVGRRMPGPVCHQPGGCHTGCNVNPVFQDGRWQLRLGVHLSPARSDTPLPLQRCCERWPRGGAC